MFIKMLTKLAIFSVDHPKLIILLTIFITILFAIQFPKITIDTDPKHMLSQASPVRKNNDKVEKDFELNADVIVLGIVNKNGVINKKTLSRITKFTNEIKKISGVISQDIISFTTIDNVLSEENTLIAKPVLERIPETDKELELLKKSIIKNPLFVNRIISPDATATAIYVPIKPAVNGKEVADKIKQLLPKDAGDDEYYLAGDPVARDTFGIEMFRQMGLFSPIAGIVMCIAIWIMFRSVPLIAANMSVAMVSIIWCMGLLIGMKFPVHIMSSMSPVFLMAIATDSIHIFNEFAFRFREVRDKRSAVIDTMAVVANPVFYSDITTAVGFASLATASIVPVKIFGLFIGFGTLVILLMSFTLVPAILMLIKEDSILKITQNPEQKEVSSQSYLTQLGKFCIKYAKGIAAFGGILLIISGVGLYKIKVNNNMVNWFKYSSPIRTADRIMNKHLGGTSTAYLVIETQTENSIKDPAMLKGIENLQKELEKDPRVGKTFSVADYVKRINRVLHNDDPNYDRIPDSSDEIGQYIFLFSMSAKQKDLNNVVDYPFQKAIIHLQLKTWDAGVMEDIIKRTDKYLAKSPLPGGAKIQPAGIAYFNLVWNSEVLWGMVESFLWGLILVLILLIIQTRSLLLGVISFLPLIFTILIIYGVVGLIGKDFDMPVAVLSTLSLGLAIDFAIHFVGRFQHRYREFPKLDDALIWTVERPGKGIFLNAILFALGFLVMVFADLTPYITVGVLMAVIMLISAAMSIIYLPGLIRLFHKEVVK
ncbi:MMPL family transporter [Candidatus Desantisbacteria bacterium]|nr:MMPL family transporter [Candidatus Desantisbacteria bacterium]